MESVRDLVLMVEYIILFIVMCLIAWRTRRGVLFWLSSSIAVLVAVSLFLRFGHLLEYTPVFG
jgi:hypothetical protein